MGAFETIEARLQLSSDGFKSSIGDAVNSLGSLESKATGTHKAVGALGVGLAAVAAGGIKKSIGASMDLQSALNESQAIMGDLTQGEMKAMEDAARSVGKTTTFSAEEAGGAFYYLASAGMDAEQATASMGDVAQFAQAGMFSLQEATDLATDAQSALGMTSEDAAENAANLNSVMDVLVKSNTLANASVQEFSEALTNKAGAALKNTNKDVEEGAAVLAAYADQGIKGQKAGERLNIVLRDLQSAAQEDAGAFEDLGVSVYDADGEMRNMADIIADLEQATEGMSTEQKNAALATLGLSQQAQDGITPLLGQSEAIREYEKELGNAGGTAEEVSNNQLKSLSAQWDLLKSQITDIGIGIGNNLLPGLTRLVDIVSGAVGAFVRINDATDGWAGTIALVGTLVGGLAMAAGSLSAVIGAGGLATTVAAVSGAIGGLGSALAILTGPVGWAIAAAALLAMAWKTNFGGIRDHTMRVVNVLKEEFGPAIQWLKNVASDLLSYLGGGGGGGLSGAFATVGEYIKPLIPLISDGLIWAIRGLANITRSTISAMRVARQALGSFVSSTRQFGQRLVAIITQSFNRVEAVITGVMDTLRSIFGPTLSSLRLQWAMFSLQIKNEARLTWQAIKAAIAPILDWLRTTIPPVLASIQQKWQQFKAFIVPIVRTLASVARTVIGAMMSAIRTVISTGLNVVQRLWSVFGDDIKAATRMVANTVTTLISHLMDTVKTVIIVGLRIIRGDWSGAWDAIKGYVDRTTDRIKRLIDGWVDVIVGYFSTLKTDGVGLVRDLMDSIVDLVRDGISDFKTAGKDLIAAFADGIADKLGDVKGAVDDIVQAARDRLPGSDAKTGPLSDLSETGPALVDTFARGMESNAGRAERAAEKVAAAARKPLDAMSWKSKLGELSTAGIEQLGEEIALSRHSGPLNKEYINMRERLQRQFRELQSGKFNQQAANTLQSGIGQKTLNELIRKRREAKRKGMVQAEDGTWVDPSFYNKRAKKSRKSSRRSTNTGRSGSTNDITLALTEEAGRLLTLVDEDGNEKEAIRISAGNLAGL